MSLKNGKSERLSQLKEIDSVVRWLNLIEKNKLGEAFEYDCEELPYIEGCGGFTNYRLMIDM